ncbi:MAG: amidohydrolase [Bradymonadaceae bacterium]
MRVRWIPISLALALLAVGCASWGGESGREVEASDIDWPGEPDGEPRNLTPNELDPETVLFEGATILTAAGRKLTDGHMLIADGTIRKVSADPIEAPEEATVIDASGKYLTPGIIDTHSHTGVYPVPFVKAHADGNEATNNTTPQVDAGDSIWVQDPAYQRAVAGGVTALQVLPGSANLIGGRTTVLEMHPGISAQAMVFERAPDGMKMACGENPKRVYGQRGQMPSTRMGNAAVLRATFQKARELERSYQRYRHKLAAWKSKPEDQRNPAKKPKPPSRDLGLENLIRAMNGELLLHVHCYRADDMATFLQIAEQFDLRVRSFHHGLEAYKIRDLLAKWNISVSTWADWWGYKIEMHDGIPQNAGLISAAGGRAVIHSDSSFGVQRLNQEAAKAYDAAVDSGLDVSVNEALRWITANAAWTLGIEDVTGTLEAGKRADVVLWSEHPFSVYARAEKVWVEGVREYDRSRNAAPWSDFEVGQHPVPARELVP